MKPARWALALLLSPALAQDPASVDLAKLDRWRPAAGDACRVTNAASGMATEVMPLAFRYEFSDRIEAVDEAGRPTRWSRTYEAFEDKRLDAPLELRPIAITREKERHAFAGKDGWTLPEFLRERLDEELNETLEFSPDAWRPPGPVAPGAEWTLSREAVGWLLGKSTLAGLELERAGARFEGTSERAGRVWGAVRFLVRGKLEGTPIELVLVVRAPLDGTSCEREEEASMRAGPHTRLDWKIVRAPT